VGFEIHREGLIQRPDIVAGGPVLDRPRDGGLILSRIGLDFRCGVDGLVIPNQRRMLRFRTRNVDAWSIPVPIILSRSLALFSLHLALSPFSPGASSARHGDIGFPQNLGLLPFFARSIVAREISDERVIPQDCILDLETRGYSTVASFPCGWVCGYERS
jgi:hypothetical protein